MVHLLLICAVCLAYPTTAKEVYNIGFLLNDISLQSTIEDVLEDINENSYFSVEFNVSFYLLSSDTVQATTDICNHLIANKVYVIITTNAVNSTEGVDTVSYVSAFFSIPVVAVHARASQLTNKKDYPLLLRTVPPYFDQARVWAAMIRHLKWNRVNFVTADDHEGRITYIKFSSWAYQYNIMIERTIMFPSEERNLSSHLEALRSMKTKVILLACSAEDAINVYQNADAIGILGAGYIWISNQQSVSGIALPHVPQGLLAVRLLGERSTRNHIRDAFHVVANALDVLHKKKTIHFEPPTTCQAPNEEWKSGEVVYRALLNTSVQGNTGTVSFDWYGDRTNAVYGIYNVKEDAKGKRSLARVGAVKSEKDVNISLADILWPGNQTEVTKGVFISNNLRIVTLESFPFVYVVERPASRNCSDLDYADPKNPKRIYRHIPCKGNTSKLKGQQHCCKGFCMDLLMEIAERTNFTYDLHLSEDGKYGMLTRVNRSNVKKWDGMVGEIVERKADLILAALAISQERAQYIEYSKPFKYQGITILVKTNKVQKTLYSFLEPFKTELWLLVLLSVHLVAIIMYLLDRFSPFGRYRLTLRNKEERALDLSSAMWFSWGVLLNSGIGEGTPRSFSARVLGMVWAGFAMIVIASYTANLAAYLVLDRPKPVVTGIDDPTLRNPSDDFKYATVANSSVHAYFRRQVELSSMYTFMEKNNVKSELEGIEKVKSGELKAFIWDSPILFHEASKNCKVTTVGDLFGRSGYGVGMPKGSPWSNDISLAILHLHESGTMEEFEMKWIDFGNCPVETQSTTLGLNHMLGVFIMVAAGIGTGIIIVILEVLYYKHKGWRKQQQKVLKKTTARWQEQVQERKAQAELRVTPKNQTQNKSLSSGRKQKRPSNGSLTHLSTHPLTGNGSVTHSGTKANGEGNHELFKTTSLGCINPVCTDGSNDQ